MRIGVIDVGSNTTRLLVAEAAGGALEPLREERVRLALGVDVERLGRISPTRLAAAASAVRRLVALARKLDADPIEVVVTAPGRQSANAEELLAALRAAARLPVRTVSAEEEGALSYRGAVSAAPELEGIVAVCDVGGASTELAVGESDGDPSWLRSVDVGAVRLTERLLASEPRDAAAVEAAREEAERTFAALVPPLPSTALATGGCARALRKVVGPTLGADELLAAQRVLTELGSGEAAERYKLDPDRARILLAGALILAAVQSRIVVPFAIARGGIREGLAHELLLERAA
jgi:exopolyphosphatase / guanosine-5'-triphosphate,3'-diphosphate pyrophosphatase